MTVNGSPSISGYAFHNEDQSEFLVDNSALTINGNANNDFKAKLEIDNGGSIVVDGDFLNEDQSEIKIGNGSLHITGDFTNDFKSTFDPTPLSISSSFEFRSLYEYKLSTPHSFILKLKFISSP